MISPIAYNRVHTIANQLMMLPTAVSAPSKKTVITIIGSGNSAHVCAALFEENSKGKVITQLFTSTPEVWSDEPVVTFPDGKTQQTGKIYLASSDPAKVFPQSDAVLWTGPVYATKKVFERIKPHIDISRTYVGTIFGQGLVHVSALRTFGPDVKFFALRNIPWLCRLTTKGKQCEIVGPKSSIEVMTINVPQRWIYDTLEPLFTVQKTGKYEPVIKMSPDFCPIVFNPANQIIHPAVYWSHFRHYDGRPLRLGTKTSPGEWLYRDMDETAGQSLQTLDEELQAIKDGFFEATGAVGCQQVIPLAERLILQYGSQIKDRSSMGKMVSTNAAYSMAKTPVLKEGNGVKPNPDHRVVQDDIGWGLCVLVSIAERLSPILNRHLPTTEMRKCIEWHQNLMGKEFLKNGKLEGKDCSELVLVRPGDSLELVTGVSGVSRRNLSSGKGSGAGGKLFSSGGERSRSPSPSGMRGQMPVVAAIG